MNVLVDTCIWSEAFRKGQGKNGTVVDELRSLIENGLAVMIGAIRQEILLGIKNPTQASRLKEAIRSFPDVLVRSQDYELAAELHDNCRAHGIQGSNTDFLICAVAHNRKMPVFTTDKDFRLFNKHLRVELFG